MKNILTLALFALYLFSCTNEVKVDTEDLLPLCLDAVTEILEFQSDVYVCVACVQDSEIFCRTSKLTRCLEDQIFEPLGPAGEVVLSKIQDLLAERAIEEENEK